MHGTYVREVPQRHFQNALNHPKGFFAGWNGPIILLGIKKQHFHLVSELHSLLKMFEKQWQNNIISNKAENGERGQLSMARQDEDASDQAGKDMKKRWNGKIKPGCPGK